jgi:RNA-directed DNA polymerase
MLWKQWKNPRTRVRNLKKLGISHSYAMTCGNARKPEAKLSKPACKAGENGNVCWRMSRVKWVIIAMPKNYFIRKYGLFLPGS